MFPLEILLGVVASPCLVMGVGLLNISNIKLYIINTVSIVFYRKYKKYRYDTSIVITGNEINEYFKVLLSAMEQLFPDLAKKTLHFGHGMLRLPEGKMSSRTGKVVAKERTSSPEAAKPMPVPKTPPPGAREKMGEAARAFAGTQRFSDSAATLARLRNELGRKAAGEMLDPADIAKARDNFDRWYGDVLGALRTAQTEGADILAVYDRVSALIHGLKETSARSEIWSVNVGTLMMCFQFGYFLVRRLPADRRAEFMDVYLDALTETVAAMRKELVAWVRKEISPIASPDIVQIMAADTPLAMLRAAALPRSAMESNTASMPRTVPRRPSNGAVKTTVASIAMRRSRRGTSSWPASCTMSRSSAARSKSRFSAATVISSRRVPSHSRDLPSRNSQAWATRSRYSSVVTGSAVP